MLQGICSSSIKFPSYILRYFLYQVISVLLFVEKFCIVWKSILCLLWMRLPFFHLPFNLMFCLRFCLVIPLFNFFFTFLNKFCPRFAVVPVPVVFHIWCLHLHFPIQVSDLAQRHLFLHTCLLHWTSDNSRGLIFSNTFPLSLLYLHKQHSTLKSCRLWFWIIFCLSYIQWGNKLCKVFNIESLCQEPLSHLSHSITQICSSTRF